MSTNEGNEGRLLEEAQQVVDRAYQRIKVDRQYRRLSQALRKLGVTQIAGPSWCFIDEDSLEITLAPSRNTARTCSSRTWSTWAR